MASSWGSSWGASWGESWGLGTEQSSGFTGGKRQGTSYARKTLSRLEREKRRKPIPVEPELPLVAQAVPFNAADYAINPLDPAATFRPFADDEDEAVALLLLAA